MHRFGKEGESLYHPSRPIEQMSNRSGLKFLFVIFMVVFGCLSKPFQRFLAVLIVFIGRSLRERNAREKERERERERERDPERERP